MDWTFIVSVLGSVILATLGYFLNGRQNRTLEKRKTKYHEKLKAYRRMNESFSRLRDNLLFLKTYLGRSLEEGDSETLEKDVLLMLSHLTITRQHAKMMDSQVVHRYFDEYNEIVKTESLESKKGRERIRGWLDSAYASLLLFRIHMMMYDAERFERAFLDADILIDDWEIENSANALMNSVMTDLMKWDEEDPTKTVSVQEVIRRLDHIAVLHKRMRGAMYNDLENTL